MVAGYFTKSVSDRQLISLQLICWIDVFSEGQFINDQLQMGFFDLKDYKEPPYEFQLSPGDITGIVIGT